MKFFGMIKGLLAALLCGVFMLVALFAPSNTLKKFGWFMVAAAAAVAAFNE